MPTSPPTPGQPAAGTPPPAQFRAVLPRSLAGRLWAAAALVAGPVLLLAAAELPGRLLDHRLPPAGVDRFGREWVPLAEQTSGVRLWAAYTLAVWAAFPVVRFLPAEKVRRAGLWAGLVPLLYVFEGSLVGTRVGLVLQNLDAEGYSPVRAAGPFAAHYTLILASLAVGALLARQVIRHLPRPAPGRVRAAWVGSAPLGIPTLAGYAVVGAFFAFLAGWVQTASPAPGVITAVVMLAVWHWQLGSTDITISPAGVQVTSGALRPLRYTHTLPHAEIRDVEVVRVPPARAVWHTLWPSGKRCAFRAGPAVRVHAARPDTRPWLLGMESTAQAEQAATAIRTWRQPTTTATTM